MGRRSRLLVALVAVALTAACGASEPEPPAEGAPTTTRAGADEAEATAGLEFDPAPGRVLEQFVDSAHLGDGDRLWQLLSTGSRERLGPTADAFADRFVAGFKDGLGTFAGSDAEIVVSGSDERGWGLAAIAGDRERSGRREFAAYAAALRLEGGEWRLELGTTITLRVLDGTPADVLEVEIAAEEPIVAAGLWVDAQPLRSTARRLDDSRLVIRAERLQLGRSRHVGVTFARTRDAAVAGAFPLTRSGDSTQEGDDVQALSAGI